jgi:hypothetical protein
VHNLTRFRHDRAEIAMMSGQHRDAGLFAGFDKPGRACHGVADRLLHDYRDAGGHALKTTVNVHLIRRGEDDAVGLARFEQLGQVRVQRHVVLARQLRTDRAGIDDRGKFGRRTCHDLFDVPITDQPCAGDRDSDPTHEIRPSALASS